MQESRGNITVYRVIYGDTDKMGVVYYATYLRWFERGRSELLRQIGMPYADIEQRGIYFPVTEATCRYFKSARYDDIIAIETTVAAVSRASLMFSYKIVRQPDAILLASGSTKHACIDKTGRVVRLEADMARALERVANA
jgi:acyl-CoA thioester hydrolase